MEGRIKRKKSEGTKLPLLGKIKVGIKGEKYPKSLDYFVADGKYANVFDDIFGKEPKSIPIVFISDDIRTSCNERYECRDNKGRLAGYGDGENMYLYNGNTEEYEQVDKETKDGKDALKEAGKWETILTIKFVIPQIKTVFGMWQFTTKGQKSSIPAIRDTFDAVLETAGTVKNIPFDLQVQKVKSQRPDSKSLFPVVTLIPNISKDNLYHLANYLQAGNDIKQLGQINNSVVENLMIEHLEENQDEIQEAIIVDKSNIEKSNEEDKDF